MMLDRMIDADERVLWSCRPHARLHIVGNPLAYLVAIIWLLFDLSLFGTLRGAETSADDPFMAISVPFMLFHLMPVWYVLGSLIYRAVTWHRSSMR